jgi:50S ribosomal protein L16 3-hydroxylase
MLAAWLGDLGLETFRSELLQQRPIAQPGTVAERDAWRLLGEVLAAPVAPDVLVVVGGQLLDLPTPRALAELQAYLRVGIGVCLRHTERSHPELRAVADAFEHDLGAAQVQMFVTAGGTHGFGWHYDDEDVFIAQLAGEKDYYFRANTVTTEPARPAAFAKFRDEGSPLATATLVAGDFLYIPARWWHVALCRADAVSLSVGVIPRAS